jgi:hypothetical protein
MAASAEVPARRRRKPTIGISGISDQDAGGLFDSLQILPQSLKPGFTAIERVELDIRVTLQQVRCLATRCGTGI